MRPLFLIIFYLLMHTQKFQNFMVWIKLPQKKWWISWVCFSIYLENRRIWMVGFGKNFSRCRYAIYLQGVQGLIPNLWCSFDVRISVTSLNEWKSWSDMENVTYNCTPTYGTRKSFVSVYSFCINVYDKSYFPGTTTQRTDIKRQRSDHTIL